MNTFISEKTADDIYDQLCYDEGEDNYDQDDYRTDDRMSQMIDKYGY